MQSNFLLISSILLLFAIPGFTITIQLSPPVGWQVEKNMLGAEIAVYPSLDRKEKMTSLLVFKYPMKDMSESKANQILEQEIKKMSAQPGFAALQGGSFNTINRKGVFSSFKNYEDGNIFQHFALILPDKNDYYFIYFSSPLSVYEMQFKQIEKTLKNIKINP